QPIGQNLSRLRALVGSTAIIFEGTGGLTLVDTYRRGIQGSMPAADLPWVHVALWKALESGDTERTNAFHALLCSLISLMPTLDAFLCIEKYLLVKQGIFPSGQLRGPVGFKLDEPLRQEVDRLFDLLHTAVYQTWKI
ncbi:MAG: dihydrodipicolinate synthase family protein, partial [Chthoniobacterales bacterium]